MQKQMLIIVAFLSAGCAAVHAQSKVPRLVPIILDTDIGPDYDDVGAVAVLHALSDKGEAKPLAVIASNKNKLVAPTINLLNIYFGRPGLPIGAPKAADAPDHGAVQQWPELLVSRYPHTIKSTEEIPDAVELYRKLLAAQPNKSVTIVTVGFLTNLARLLDSPPDRYSKLNGRTLVAKKVKQLVSMAGKFPAGREYNVFIDSAASEKVFMNWPTPVLYSGFEIGQKIITGKQLTTDESITNSPVKDAFAKAMSYRESDHNGRMSWDQTAVLVAVRGVSPYYKIQRGHIVLNGGNNEWKDDPKGKQSYLVALLPPEKVRAEIEALMMHQPNKK